MEESTSVVHTKKLVKRTWMNRIFAIVYASTVIALRTLLTTIIIDKSTNDTHITAALLMLVADIVLAFMWFTHQIFRLFPINRQTFPENLVKDESKYPRLDVFICTADPYREPPMDVVNAALSVMAYDYPKDKLSVYVSDDGESQLTLFALMEAAKFAKHWLPFCRLNNLVVRSPEAYFKSLKPSDSPRNIHNTKALYESMKTRVKNVVIRGSVDPRRTDDNESSKIQARTVCKIGLIAPEHAEAMAIKEALSWVKDKGWQNVILESDCLVAVQVIRSKVAMSSPFGRVVEDCRDMIRKYNTIEVFFVKRSANMAVHELARVSYSFPDRVFDMSSVPIDVHVALEVDSEN